MLQALCRTTIEIKIASLKRTIKITLSKILRIVSSIRTGTMYGKKLNQSIKNYDLII